MKSRWTLGLADKTLQASQVECLGWKPGSIPDSSVQLMHTLADSRRCLKCLGSCHPAERPGIEFPALGFCPVQPWGMNQWTGVHTLSNKQKFKDACIYMRVGVTEAERLSAGWFTSLLVATARARPDGSHKLGTPPGLHVSGRN